MAYLDGKKDDGRTVSFWASVCEEKYTLEDRSWAKRWKYCLTFSLLHSRMRLIAMIKLKSSPWLNSSSISHSTYLSQISSKNLLLLPKSSSESRCDFYFFEDVNSVSMICPLLWWVLLSYWKLFLQQIRFHLRYDLHELLLFWRFGCHRFTFLTNVVLRNRSTSLSNAS